MKGGFVGDGRGFVGHARGFVGHARGFIRDLRGSLAHEGDPRTGADAAKKRLGEDEPLRKQIFVHAHRLTNNLAHAKELAQEGMAKAIARPKSRPRSNDWGRGDRVARKRSAQFRGPDRVDG